MYTIIIIIIVIIFAVTYFYYEAKRRVTLKINFHLMFLIIFLYFNNIFLLYKLNKSTNLLQFSRYSTRQCP